MEEKIIEYLDELLEKSNPKNVYIIHYKGRRLTMPSNKSSWTTLGAAKNALRYAVPYFVQELPTTWRDRLEVIKRLEEERVIKYIKVF